MSHVADTTVTPDRIFEIGFAFAASKTLLSAIELGVFTELAKGPADLTTLKSRFRLHDRSAADFFETLVALKFLQRQAGRYENTPATAKFLDKAKPEYIGGMFEMANNRLYPFWANLTEGLRTGEPQNEAKTGDNLFDRLYEDPARVKEFLSAMTGISLPTADAIAEKFEWRPYRTFIDVGCAQGGLPVRIAKAHRHLTGGGFDLPVVRPATASDYTPAECQAWFREAGFKGTRVEPLAGPDSMVVGIK